MSENKPTFPLVVSSGGALSEQWGETPFKFLGKVNIPEDVQAEILRLYITSGKSFIEVCHSLGLTDDKIIEELEKRIPHRSISLKQKFNTVPEIKLDAKTENKEQLLPLIGAGLKLLEQIRLITELDTEELSHNTKKLKELISGWGAIYDRLAPVLSSGIEDRTDMIPLIPKGHIVELQERIRKIRISRKASGIIKGEEEHEESFVDIPDLVSESDGGEQ